MFRVIEVVMYPLLAALALLLGGMLVGSGLGHQRHLPRRRGHGAR